MLITARPWRAVILTVIRVAQQSLGLVGACRRGPVDGLPEGHVLGLMIAVGQVAQLAWPKFDQMDLADLDFDKRHPPDRRPRLSASTYDFTLPAMDGGSLSLADYAGQVLLVVNTASACGFTPQYAGQDQLWRDNRERALVVLGCPCDQFGRQEPGDAAAIRAFCTAHFAVSFPPSAGSRRTAPTPTPCIAT